jgi:hypothetical protein
MQDHIKADRLDKLTMLICFSGTVGHWLMIHLFEEFHVEENVLVTQQAKYLSLGEKRNNATFKIASYKRYTFTLAEQIFSNRSGKA